jgi:NAD(P)-dependent dehydrogenase (short-subunit alcohol dehydrogenase family)
MHIDLNGKTALVTGASRGIGKAIATRMAQAGAKVIVHYNENERAAQKTCDSLDGADHLILQADLADISSLHHMIKNCLKRTSKIDILVNNAGIFVDHPLTELPFDKWQRIWDETIMVNLSAPAFLSYFIGNHMIAKGGGRIINITSRGAFRGEPNSPAYGAAKAGLNSFGQSLAKALAPHKVFVYTIAPGFVETEMVKDILEGPEGEAIINQGPLKRAADPDEIARTALFLAGEGIDYLTGCIIDANGASYLRT